MEVSYTASGGYSCPDVLKLNVDVLPSQGVVGDAGERGPPGPDGNEVRTLVLVNAAVLFFLSCTFHLPLPINPPFCPPSLKSGSPCL